MSNTFATMKLGHLPHVASESYMRKVVKPLEGLLTSHKRIVLKDSAVGVFSMEGWGWTVPNIPFFLLPGECGVLWSQSASSRCVTV